MKGIYQSIRQHNKLRSMPALIADALIYWLLFGFAWYVTPIVITRIGVNEWLLPILVILIAIIPGSGMLGTIVTAEIVTRWIKIK